MFKLGPHIILGWFSWRRWEIYGTLLSGSDNEWNPQWMEPNRDAECFGRCRCRINQIVTWCPGVQRRAGGNWANFRIPLLLRIALSAIVFIERGPGWSVNLDSTGWCMWHGINCRIYFLSSSSRHIMQMPISIELKWKIFCLFTYASTARRLGMCVHYADTIPISYISQ